MKLSEFRGKVLLLSFWATWCGPCMELVPHARALLERHRAKPFAIVGVNQDGPEARQKMLTNNPVTWRLFKDKLGDKTSIRGRWKVQGLPTLILVDRRGIIRQRWLGNPGNNVLDREIDRLLEAAQRDQDKKRSEKWPKVFVKPAPACAR